VKRETATTAVEQPCMRCGKEALHGRHVCLDLEGSPEWRRVAFVFGLLPGMLLRRLMGRPPRHFSYWLCLRCQRTRRIKQALAAVAWAGFLGILVAAIVTGRWGLWGAIAFWLFFVAVFATAASSLSLVREKELYRPRY
jgi:hypothetical protein